MPEHPLDNPVWHALRGPHARFAFGTGKALHYAREVAPFSAIAEPSPEAYADLAVDLPEGGVARLFRPFEEPLPEGWEQVDGYRMLQMVAEEEGPLPQGGPPVMSLSAHDAADMQELADLTKPGPFGPRTFELGSYIGVREEGRLIAMAGERMRAGGFVELSAVCTHPDARGRGLAQLLMRQLMHRIFKWGEQPFLHVRVENTARALYERLGFKLRREVMVLWRKPLPQPEPAEKRDAEP
ncbi:MAG TPA: GNAT family N-acetyltransferase [Burkholderiales bacterium]|nr:GNAT family N-acetyltransferase [Burkholderiales bacterium]